MMLSSCVSEALQCRHQLNHLSGLRRALSLAACFARTARNCIRAYYRTPLKLASPAAQCSGKRFSQPCERAVEEQSVESWKSYLNRLWRTSVSMFDERSPFRGFRIPHFLPCAQTQVHHHIDARMHCHGRLNSVSFAAVLLTSSERPYLTLSPDTKRHDDDKLRSTVIPV